MELETIAWSTGMRWKVGATVVTACILIGVFAANLVDAEPEPPPAPVVDPPETTVAEVTEPTDDSLPIELAPPPARTEEIPLAVGKMFEQLDEPSRGKRRAKRRSSTSTSEPDAGEQQLIDQARRAVQGGQLRKALNLLDRHQRHFPTGQFADERRVLRVQALCKLGRIEQARGEAYWHGKNKPETEFARRIDAACDRTL